MPTWNIVVNATQKNRSRKIHGGIMRILEEEPMFRQLYSHKESLENLKATTFVSAFYKLMFRAIPMDCHIPMSFYTETLNEIASSDSETQVIELKVRGIVNRA